MAVHGAAVDVLHLIYGVLLELFTGDAASNDVATTILAMMLTYDNMHHGRHVGPPFYFEQIFSI